LAKNCTYASHYDQNGADPGRAALEIGLEEMQSLVFEVDVVIAFPHNPFTSVKRKAQSANYYTLHLELCT
jgi:hypothetical protein